jgi:multiple sugar transport system substrate-binding protein
MTRTRADGDSMSMFLSRRQLLRRGVATAGAALAAAALAACGGGSSSSGNIPTATGAGTKAATTAAGSTPAASIATVGAAPTAFAVATSTPATSSASGSAAPPTTASGSAAAASFDWQRFKGTTIRMFVSLNPVNEPVKAGIADFEKLTGIKVNFEELPENNAREKLTVEFTAGSSTIDIFGSSLHQERLLFAKNGWYAPINEYLKDAKMTAPDYDWDGDVFQGAKDIVTVNGQIIGAPSNMDTNITYYRKDLLDKAGLKPPKNMDELEAAAKAIHNPPNVYGFAARGQKTSNATQIDPYFRNFGGGYFDKDGNPILNSDGDIKAVDFYAGLLKKYGPPGVTNFSWPEISALFQQGRVGLYTDGAGFAGPFADPAKSVVADKTGYGIFPAGPAGNFPPLFASSWSIYAKSKNKEASWFFIQYITNKANILKTLAGGTAVARNSAWANPASRVGAKLPPEYFDSTFAMLKASVPGLPPVIHVAESRDIISVGLIDVINGQDAKTVMNRVQQEFKALVDRDNN